MPFTYVGLLIPSINWTFSEPVEGTFFQLKHVVSDLPLEYFKGEICQAEISEDGEVAIIGAQPVDVQTELDLIELPKPPIFTNRRIGFRKHRENTTLPPTNKPLIWEIQLFASDYVQTQVVYV